MKTERELELKLSILDKTALEPERYDDFVSKLWQLLGGKKNKRHIRISHRPPQTLETDYYDTKDLDLRKSKIVYRVRRGEAENVATIKTDIPQPDDSSPMLAHRLEQTVTCPEDISPVNLLDVFKNTPAADLLKPVVGRKMLHFLFATKFNRISYVIEEENKSRILLCVDTGFIIADQAREEIKQIELELIEGEPADLFATASAISGIIPVYIDMLSKYARGLILSGRATLREMTGLPPSKKYRLPDESEPFEHFVQAAVRYLRSHLIYCRYALTNPSDYEAVHAFRVLLRQFTTIAAIAKALPSANDMKKMRDLAKILLKKSAPARQSDIFLQNWKEFLRSLDGTDKGVGSKITSILTAQRQLQKALFLESLQDKSFATLLLLMTKWLYESPKATITAAQAHELLSASIARKDLVIHELVLNSESLAPKKLHKIRLAVKEKRSIYKFFPVKPADDDSGAEKNTLKRLQDVLGTLNDIADICQNTPGWIPECELTVLFNNWLKEKESMLIANMTLDAEKSNAH